MAPPKKYLFSLSSRGGTAFLVPLQYTKVPSGSQKWLSVPNCNGTSTQVSTTRCKSTTRYPKVKVPKYLQNLPKSYMYDSGTLSTDI